MVSEAQVAVAVAVAVALAAQALVARRLVARVAALARDVGDAGGGAGA
ncbi:MAG TPA: hypothetical protein VFW50_14335 [Streptosporangiaceae bacterium]|nr:hypothetical protein [Streptosporangiaceae bacterium]